VCHDSWSSLSVVDELWAKYNVRPLSGVEGEHPTPDGRFAGFRWRHCSSYHQRSQIESARCRRRRSHVFVWLWRYPYVSARACLWLYSVCVCACVSVYIPYNIPYVPSALYRKQNYRFFPLSPKLYQEPKQRTTIIAHRLIIGRQPVYPAYLDYCVTSTDRLLLVTFWTIYEIGALCRRDRRGKSYSFFVHTPLTPSLPCTHTLSSFVGAAVRKKPLTKRSTGRGRYWFSPLDTLTQIFPLFF